MRTRVLNHFHTFHPEAQAELNRLAAEEGSTDAGVGASFGVGTC